MKIVVDEEGCIPLILGQSMAEVTTSLGIEQFPTAFGRVADGVCTSRDEMVERRIERSQRPFVGCNSAQHILLVHTPAESLHELGLIILVAGDPGHSIPDAGRAHLERVSDRQCRLLLQRSDPAVPKLMFVIEGIQNGWGGVIRRDAIGSSSHPAPCTCRQCPLPRWWREEGCCRKARAPPRVECRGSPLHVDLARRWPVT